VFTIRELKKHELPIFFSSCKLEGWDNDISHIECLFKVYANDFFIAYKDKDIVGFVLALKESKEFGTISNLLVLNGFRSLGFGKKLLDFALKHLQGCQIAIDSVLGKEKIYESVGFKSYFTTSIFSSYTGQTSLPKSPITVSDVRESDLLEYNKNINSLKKPYYTSCLFKSKDSLYKAIYKDKLISSYAIRLTYKDGYKLLISSNEINEAVTLFFSLLEDLDKSSPIYMEVSQTEQLLLTIAKLLNMQKLSTTTKMYNKILN